MNKPIVASAILILLSWTVFDAQAFTVAPGPATRSCTSNKIASWARTTTTTTTTRAAAVLDQDQYVVGSEVEVVDVYNQLGVERGNLALGVKPEEVLKYIGT